MRGTLPALMVCVFGVTTGEFVLASILPGVAAELDVSIPAAGPAGDGVRAGHDRRRTVADRNHRRPRPGNRWCSRC